MAFFRQIENYIYISHLGDDGKYFIIPTSPDTIQDSMTSTFASENPLSRSAPIFTYSYSGPRTVTINLQLHRDMMDDANVGISNVNIEDGEDYIDTLIKSIQAISVPKYNVTNKAVEPPIIAIRFGNEIFIRGIVNGSISVSYSKPILNNGKYALINIGFTIYEIDPYDSAAIEVNGSFRGLTKGLRKGFNLETSED
nr:MAG TPA: hypothetical protein [Caudoviricetes sp.]